MSHPLGSRFGRQKAGERRVVMKPAVDSYVVNVRLPTVIIDAIQRRLDDPNQPTMSSNAAHALPNRDAPRGQYVAATQNVATVKVPTYATAYDAVSCILQAVDYHETPVEEFMLAQCFADFTINFSLRGLFGANGPIRNVVEFPYYLSLVVNPYVAKQKVLLATDEPQGRAHIVGQQRLFHLFCQEYAEMLEKLGSHYQFLVLREQDARRTKKMQERRSYFDIAEVQLFRGERASRTALAAAEQTSWNALHYSATSLLRQQQLSEQLVRDHIVQAAAFQRSLARELADSRWVQMLRQRYADTISGFEHQAQEGERYRRALYTDSRIRSTLRGARETNLTPEQFHERRVAVGRDRHAALHVRPEAANGLAINRDIYSNTRVL